MAEEEKKEKPAEEGAKAAKPKAEKAAKPKTAKPKTEKSEGKAGTKAAAGKAGAEEKAEKTAAPKVKDDYVPRLKKLYKEKIGPELFKEFGYKSVMQTPRLVKIVVSMGVGEAITNKKLLDSAVNELSAITGQHAVKTKARKSIANFKIRAGQEIGAMVTLRGDMMYEFLDRLVNVALPRVKDFRGVNANAFDGHGNYALGIQEQIIFPEIDFDKIERVSGLNIVIVTTAKTDAEAKAFLAKFGMPFKK
jgi:large subunit ribosomal protein L5